LTAGDDFWDNLFLGCAFAAYVEQAAIERRSVPDSEATRRRAFDYYELAIAEKNRRAAAPPPADNADAGP
jgi:hypothetical protein